MRSESKAEVGGAPLKQGRQSEWWKSAGRLLECWEGETTLVAMPEVFWKNRKSGGL